jgi:hypothetical protein
MRFTSFLAAILAVGVAWGQPPRDRPRPGGGSRDAVRPGDRPGKAPGGPRDGRGGRYRPNRSYRPRTLPRGHRATGKRYRGRYRGNRTRYYREYGYRFRYGTYYRGRWHRNFSYRYFDRRWRVPFYWEPSARAWYYWYAPKKCYYPVRAIRTYRPAVVAEPADLQELPSCDPQEAPELPGAPGRRQGDDDDGDNQEGP